MIGASGMINGVGMAGMDGSPAALDASLRLAEEQASFRAVLGRVSAGEPARDAAERFVAMALVHPLLKEFRESNQAAPPFAPTEAEKQFGALLDAELANRVVRAAGFPLVDRLARELRGGTGAGEQGSGDAGEQRKVDVVR